MNKKKKGKKKKVILAIIIIVGFIAIIDNNSDKDDMAESEMEQAETSKELEKDAYGWTFHDYEEFSVALKMIADNYLKGYKLPSYDKWQFAEFDEEGRILAMTNELILKGDNEKHIIVCVFSLSENIGENGLHESVKTHFFGVDNKTYFDDGSCKDVFEKNVIISK